MNSVDEVGISTHPIRTGPERGSEVLTVYHSRGFNSQIRLLLWCVSGAPKFVDEPLMREAQNAATAANILSETQYSSIIRLLSMS